MSLWQLFLASDATYQCVAELGEIGIVQFRDLNPDLTAFQRHFIKEVRRCDEMERKLRYLEGEIKKENITIAESEHFPPAPQPKEMVDLEAALDKLDGELREVNANYEQLNKNSLELTELKHVLLNSQGFLDEKKGLVDVRSEDSAAEGKSDGGLDEALTQNFKKFRFVAGVINAERVPGFERMLFRAGRGNILFRFTPIEAGLKDPVTGAELRKVVFICFYQGEQLRARVKKVCDGYHASLYPCPDTASQRRELAIGVASRIEDLKTILDQTNSHRHRVLLAAAKNIRNWFIKVRKMKRVYHTMNMFNVDLTRKCLVAECWIPNDDMARVQQALLRGNERTSSSFPPILNSMTTKEKPPTFHRTNKFTKGFQAIVNAYGMANYREVNPGLFTTATFPFLFAVMFGDVGHGFFVTLFALWMVMKEDSLKKIKGEVWGIFFGGRYIILLMGLFSMYTGFIYNDIFSKSMNIFGSSWRVNYDNKTIQEYDHLMLDPKSDCICGNVADTQCCGHYAGSPYPFGIDPIWQVAENKIVYLNSYKMKLSIILGVFHMTFGVFLNLWNFVYQKRYSAILVEFLPRIVFFWPLFGYLISLMFLKWINYGPFLEGMYQSSCAPSILITFINMMLLQYGPDKVNPTDPNCQTLFFYDGQKTVQIIFLLVALLSIPVLLLGTPMIFKFTHKEHNKKRYSNEGSVETGSGSGEGHEDHQPIVGTATSGEEEEETFSDVMIHQAIHTIEYVLECISHTASYLRLWALSLAHSQLSEVLWNMVFDSGIEAGGPYWGSIFIWGVFAAWAFLTVAILIAMEGMSAFLHTLRLHWVEFQSKFYGGNGVAFRPFNFKHVDEDNEEEE